MGWWVPACVALSSFAAFLPALQNRFVMWDDPENFLNNLHYRGLGVEQLRWMFTESARMGNYIPVSWMTLGLDYRLWGMNPTGYHLTSLLIHAANAVLFFYVVKILLGRPSSLMRAGLAALFFAVHPLRVESVAWVTERRDVVSGMFFLLTILAYLRYTQGKRGWYAVSLISYSLALLSKPIVVTLPLVLSLLDVYPLKRDARRVWLEKIPYYVLAIPAGVAAIIFQSRAGFLVSAEHLGVLQRMALGIYGAGFYVWKTIFPIGLRPLYPLGAGVHLFDPVFIGSLLFILLGSALAWRYRRQWPAFTAAWGYYLIVLLPISGLFLTGRQRAADRYSYLSCMGWAILAGWFLGGGKKSRQRLGIALVAFLAVLTLRQCRLWANSETLWTAELSSYPDSFLAHNNLAVYFQGVGRLDEAVDHYEEVLRLKPDFVEAQNNLGVALQQQGKMDEAVPHFHEAIRLNPRNSVAYASLGLGMLARHRVTEAIPLLEHALQINPNDASAHANLGVALMSRGQREAAAGHFREALRIDPTDTLSRQNLEAGSQIHETRLALPGDAEYAQGVALEKQGRWDEAASEFQAAVERNPRNADAFYHLGNVRTLQHRMEEAISSITKALEITPDHPQANNLMGAVLFSQRKPVEAIPYFQRALKAMPQYADAENNWGAALAAQRRFEEALAHFRKALEIDPHFEKARQNMEMAQRFITGEAK